MRLFVAIDINEETRRSIAALQQDLKQKIRSKGIKWVEPENMHLTVKFLGESDENKIDEIYSALELACADKKPFEINFSVVGTFGRPSRVLWLGCSAFGETSPLGGEKEKEEIIKLASDLEDAFEELGFEKENRPFSTHLTLARIKDNIDRDLQKILKDLGRVEIPPVNADAVCLYKSQLTSTGSVYTLLKKIEL